MFFVILRCMRPTYPNVFSNPQDYLLIFILYVILALSNPHQVRVWNRTASNAELFAKKTGAIPYESAEVAVRDADVVVTATGSKTPVLCGGWLKPGAFVCCKYCATFLQGAKCKKLFTLKCVLFSFISYVIIIQGLLINNTGDYLKIIQKWFF